MIHQIKTSREKIEEFRRAKSEKECVYYHDADSFMKEAQKTNTLISCLELEELSCGDKVIILPSLAQGRGILPGFHPDRALEQCSLYVDFSALFGITTIIRELLHYDIRKFRSFLAFRVPLSESNSRMLDCTNPL